MTKTKNYNLNQWAASDPIRRTDFNADNAAIDAAIKSVADTSETKTAAAQAAGDRGLAALRGALGDLCRLAYQTDGQGTYTGWRRSFDFDGLNSADRLETTTGAAVPEPDKGRVRLAADGWSGGSVNMTTTSYVTLEGSGSREWYTEDWTPQGLGKVNSVTITGSVSGSGTHDFNMTAELLLGDTVLDTVTFTDAGGFPDAGRTLTFSAAPQVDPQHTYRVKITIKNRISNATLKIKMTTVTFAATGVKCTTGGLTTAPLALTGREIMVWAQYSAPGSTTMRLLVNGAWTDLDAAGETASRTPEGTACTEGCFRLELPEAVDNVQLQMAMNSDSECYLYGYGITAL